MSKAFNVKNNTLRRLETELAALKKRFRSAQELEIEWIPNDSPKSGEVIGTKICIYEAHEAEALDTLRHEFLEYVLVNELVAPYKRLINKLISLFEEETYDRKKRLIEKLLKTI
jgi:hypothetical protein